jgi:LysR family transcriptional regulator, low CO2-responsive transcriptional regulator
MPLRHATLHQLKIFDTLARRMSFARAAEEMHLTSPALSIQVKQLSEAVEAPLYEQIGKKLHLTETGQILARACGDIFERLDRLDMELADLKGLKQGTLRLSVITGAKYLVPGQLGVFCERYPGIEVSLKVTNRERVLERLNANLDDLYILGQPPEGLTLVSEPFMENPLIVVARSDHPLAGRKAIAPSDLASENFIVREEGSGTRMTSDRFFANHGIRLKARMELGSVEAIKHAVAAGLGLAVLSSHSLTLDWSSGEFAILDVQGFPILRHWYLVHPQGKRLSVVAAAFRDFLVSQGREAGLHGG